MSNWHRFDTRSELDHTLAEYIAEQLRADIASRGSASLAVSGGSTPMGMFAALSGIELPWDKVFVTLRLQSAIQQLRLGR